MEPDTARALPRSFEKRLNTDYADFADVTAEDAARTGAEVARFIDGCAALLERLLSDEQRK
jgi:hypothetical protein